MQHDSLDLTLAELRRIEQGLALHREPAAQELAGQVWRLESALSQLLQALPETSDAP
ncbi:hypothetical protein D3C80_2080120 [compost metagenome]